MSRVTDRNATQTGKTVPPSRETFTAVDWAIDHQPEP